MEIFGAGLNVKTTLALHSQAGGEKLSFQLKLPLGHTRRSAEHTEMKGQDTVD